MTHPEGITSTAAPPLPAEQQPTGQGGSWLDRPGIADLVFLFVMVVVLTHAAKGLLDDPGLGWHLRNIDAMRAEGWWLSKDPFTYPRDQEPPAWYTNQWLGELPLYLGWKVAGLEGIAAVSAIVIAVIARTLYRFLIHDGLPWPVAVAWTALGTLGTSCSWVARPNLFTILFVLITARVLMLFHEGRLSWRGTLWLLPLFAVWANVHGGFLAGFIVVGLALAAEVALAVASFDDEARAAAGWRALSLGVLTVGLFLATLVNPYGPGLYRHALGLLGDDYFMKLHLEWKSPDFRAPGAMRYELLILLFPLVLAASRRRASLPELILSVAWLHLALTGFRYVALWVVIAVPLLARASVEIPYLQEAARRFKLTAEPGSLFFTRVGRSWWLWSVLFAAGVGVWAYASQGGIRQQQAKREQEMAIALRQEGDGKTLHKSELIIARKALDEFLDVAREWQGKHGRRPILFHSYDWGGYLTWHGWRPGPEGLLNWIDDRNEVQGRPRVEEYFEILRAEPGWEEKLARVDLICVESGAALTYRLEADRSRFRERYRDPYAVIFERVR
jgi:hypothetical protein